MKSVITISREAGSSGDVIGYELAQRLGFTCINRSFVDLIARKARVAPWQVARAERLSEEGGGHPQEPPPTAYDERQGRSLDALIQRLGYGEPLGGEEYLAALREVITDLADIGGVVIIGRGGQVLLRHRPDAFHVRILAPTEVRVAAMQRHAEIGRESALATVNIIDGLRSGLLRKVGCQDINDPALYDLVLQTGGKTDDECVEEILAKLQATSREDLFEPTVGKLDE